MAEPAPLALNLARIVHRLLVDPRGWRVDQLMEALEIRPRTYRKYRGLLQEHFDHLLDPNGRLRIVEVREGDARYLRIRVDDGPAEQDDAFLTRLVALDLVTRIVGFADGTGLAEALASARADFTAGVEDKPFYLGHVLRNANRMVHHLPHAPKQYAGQGTLIATVLRAIFFSRTLHFQSAAIDEPSPRAHRVEPLTLLHWREGLYLVARFEENGRPYLFAIDRMSDATLGGDRFQYPPPDVYDPATLFEGAFGIFQESTTAPTEVELLFAAAPWLQRYLRERTWHPTQTFEALADGRLRMRFRVSSMVEVWPWVRSFGCDVELVRPSAVEAS